jgi:GNAT superfamily N-acetyltransferase
MPALRLAVPDDLPALTALMDAAIGDLQKSFLDAAAIEASRKVMGLDTQLVRDGTYFVAEMEGRVAGCGGWSWRRTLYGGDHSVSLRDAAPLDPARDAAKIRAMYTHPDFARRGVGRAILRACEDAARERGFARAEMMATLAGEPLYRACGYETVRRENVTVPDGTRVPLVHMARILD